MIRRPATYIAQLARPQRESEQHWRRVHLAGDKSPPIDLPDRRVRRSIGTATMCRRSGKDAGVIYE
jgi:hypothetical protein